jgi:tetratricopeptide (TPR) repeat protein
MRIRRIQLYRFRGFDDLQLIFPPKENLTVFIGKNGSGKTSLLDGISMILQDSLYKHHKYDKVEWNNPLNVQNPHLYGSIALGLQGPKRSYEFSQSLSASRTRFISEDKLVLEKNRDLTDEEKMEHYKAQAKMAYDEGLYEKALEEYLKLAKVQEKVLKTDNPDLPITHYYIGITYHKLNNFEKAVSFSKKALDQYLKVNSPNNATLYRMYFNIGAIYHFLNENTKSISYLEQALKIKEETNQSNDSDLLKIYFALGVINISLNWYHYNGYNLLIINN